jgi:hypothetical protein
MPAEAAVRDSLAGFQTRSLDDWLDALIHAEWIAMEIGPLGAQAPEFMQELELGLGLGLGLGLELELTGGGVEQTPEDMRSPSWQASCQDLQALGPWLRAAMRATSSAELTLQATALGVIGALEAGALDVRPGLRHFIQGHADEMAFWLQHTDQEVLARLEADAAEPHVDFDLHQEMLEEVRAMRREPNRAPDYLSPTKSWAWVHAATSAANRYSRRLQVACHEAGHAVAIHHLNPEAIFDKVTIESQPGAAGHVSRGFNEAYGEVYLNSLESSMEHAVAAMAGRAAEERRFGKMRSDSGAVGDMAQATKACWNAITAYGLDPVFGMVCLPAVAPNESSSVASPIASTGWLHELAQQRLHVWMKWAQSEAEALVAHHWQEIEALTEELMRQQTLSNADARRVIAAAARVPGYVLKAVPV